MSDKILTEWELWACADEVIRQHGLDAPIFAAIRADQLLLDGEQDGAANWRLIVKRINELLAKPSGATN
jgi:hypothetical protein